MDLTAEPRPGIPTAVAGRLPVPDRERTDPAEALVRLEGSRAALAGIPVDPWPAEPRLLGTITVGNDRLPRYLGEISISRRELPPDPTVNVIGRISREDLALLPLIGPGTRVRLTPPSRPANG